MKSVFDKLKTFERIIDISQPVGSATACFPGDVPFTREITLNLSECGVVNLTAFKMSPHVGTHVDAPSHIEGNLESGLAGELPLEYFIGETDVIDLSSWRSAHGDEILPQALPSGYLDGSPAQRVLFRTCDHIDFDKFEKSYAYFSPSLIEALADADVKLVGIDTPSVDNVDSKTLPAHKSLLARSMVWLENLDLRIVAPGRYVLVALPLKLMELEASPVRAVLLV